MHTNYTGIGFPSYSLAPSFMAGPETKVSCESDFSLAELRPAGAVLDRIPARQCSFAGSLSSLKVDPAGFLQWLKQADERERTSASGNTISMHLLKWAGPILREVENAGPFQNPQTTETLKGLYSPELLRFTIVHALSLSSSDTFLECWGTRCIALCFMFNPSETLRELAFLSRQILPSERLFALISRAGEGVIDACIAVPSLWSHLTLSQHASALSGPIKLETLFKDIECERLCHFPADVARYVLQHQSVKAVHSLHVSGILDYPGLPTVLKFLKFKLEPEAFERVADQMRQTVCWQLANSESTAEWVSARKHAGPMRTISAAHTILRELYCICAPVGEEAKAGAEFDALVASEEVKRLDLLRDASSTCDTWLRKGSFLTPQELKELLNDLRSYSNEQLQTVIADGNSLEKGEPPTVRIRNPASFLLYLYAIHALPPFDHHTINELIRDRSVKGENYTAVLRVALTHHLIETEGVMFGSFLGNTLALPLSSDPRYAWINRGLLLKLKVILPFCGTSPELERLVDERLRIGNAAQDEYLIQIARQGIRTESAEGAHRYVLDTLRNLNTSEYGIQSWRDNFLQAYAKECCLPPGDYAWDNRKSGNTQRMLFGEHRLVPLDESDRAAGRAFRACLPNISSRQKKKLEQSEQQLYHQVSKLLRCTLSEWQQPGWSFKRVSKDHIHNYDGALSITSLREQAADVLVGKPDSELAPIIIKLCDAFERAAASGKTYARLAQTLAAKKLIVFQESLASPDECSKATLALYGVAAEPAFVQVYFPAISLMKKSVPSPTIISNQETRQKFEVIPAPKEELESLLRSCQKLIEIDSQFRGPINFPRLMTIPRERNSFLLRAGQRVTLTLALVGGAGAITELALERSSSPGAATQPGPDVLGTGVASPQSDLYPSGSIPSVRAQIAHLSNRLSSSSLDHYLIDSFVGATSSSAQQPALRGPQLEVVRSIIQRMTRLPRGNSAILYLDKHAQGDFVPVPVGAAVESHLHAREDVFSWLGASLYPQSKGPFKISIPSNIEIDSSATAGRCRELIGDKCAQLSTPRMELSEIETASPTLAKAIREARGMPAFEGAEHLRKAVSRIIKYEESPQYDQFRGNFAEYFRSILRTGQGVCGQFAVLYDESLKQAGIPSCLISAVIPDKKAPTVYFSDGFHAANMIFVPDRSGRLIARLMDATGAQEKEKEKKTVQESYLETLTLPVGLGLTSAALGLWLAAANRRRRAYQEAKALTLAYKGEVPEEPENPGELDRDASDSMPTDPTRVHREKATALPAYRVSSASVLKWVNQHPGSMILVSLDGAGGLDFERFASSTGELLDKLSTVTESTQRILARLQLSSPQADGWGLDDYLETVQVINAWQEAIKDPSYRANWIHSIKANTNLDGKSKAQLLALLSESGVDKENVLRRTMRKLLGSGDQAPIDAELFLKTAVPIGS